MEGKIKLTVNFRYRYIDFVSKPNERASGFILIFAAIQFGSMDLYDGRIHWRFIAFVRIVKVIYTSRPKRIAPFCYLELLNLPSPLNCDLRKISIKSFLLFKRRKPSFFMITI